IKNINIYSNMMNIDSVKSEGLVYNEEDKKCAPGTKFESGSCISLNDLVEMANAYNKENSSDAIKLFPSFETINRSKYKKYLVREFKNRLSGTCESQKCWSEQIFTENIKKMQAEELKNNTFRPSGPQGKFEWLNTININESMKQYEEKYADFKWLGAVPIDF